MAFDNGPITKMTILWVRVELFRLVVRVAENSLAETTVRSCALFRYRISLLNFGYATKVQTKKKYGCKLLASFLTGLTALGFLEKNASAEVASNAAMKRETKDRMV